MSAAAVEILDSPTLRANQWIEGNLDELTSRGRASLPHWNAGRREEALAEILALAVAAAHRAARRGCLSRLTAYWCVVYAMRQVRSGRRAAGASTRCVLSDATQIRGRSKTVPLDGVPAGNWDQSGDLFEVLASDHDDDPFDQVRRLSLAKISSDAAFP
jgi:hypothetical protein